MVRGRHVAGDIAPNNVGVKMLTSALVGVLVGQGSLDPKAPVPTYEMNSGGPASKAARCSIC